MQRSSPSIAALATALAKAQIELTNPEKSLIGTIELRRGQDGARQFRYAPLSSGLEIVRKTLGQHEIATVQTTAIDRTSGIINLTTVLAHSSGEWIASDWPVCPITETERPHRMGTALTYARRYALFTLVGIAGEDDLDAPDLTEANPQTEKPKIDSISSTKRGQQNASDRPKLGSPTLKCELSVALSASLRTELVREIEDLGVVDDAALWARRRLPAKNQLSASDAQQVEEAFAAKLLALQAESATVQIKPPAENTRKAAINKSLLAFPEPRRIRDRDHMRHVINSFAVADHPILIICGLRNLERSHARSVTSSRSRSVARTIARFIAAGMKNCGGEGRE